MSQTVLTRFFRADVGTIIYTKDGDVALFKRSTPPVGVWQFQQGGIDAGETPEMTLWRELKEEVGLTEAEIKTVTAYPHWTLYEDLDAHTDSSKQRLGQVHRWFFLELLPAATIDLTKASEPELSDYRFVTFQEALTHTTANKKHVYEQLETYFSHTVLPR